MFESLYLHQTFTNWIVKLKNKRFYHLQLRQSNLFIISFFNRLGGRFDGTKTSTNSPNLSASTSSNKSNFTKKRRLSAQHSTASWRSQGNLGKPTIQQTHLGYSNGGSLRKAPRLHQKCDQGTQTPENIERETRQLKFCSFKIHLNHVPTPTINFNFKFLGNKKRTNLSANGMYTFKYEFPTHSNISIFFSCGNGAKGD